LLIPVVYFRGFNFGYSAWVNNVFLGSSQGTNQYTTKIDLTNVTWTLPSSALKSGDNVVTVVFDQTGKKLQGFVLCFC
jgi:hypothetical protein